MNTITEQVLARRGVGGYRQYRIPALAVSTRGTVLAAYDGRPNLDDLPNPIDLLLRRSTDNGQTWGPQQVVRTGTGLDGYGDPSLLVDAQTGRIFLFHAAGTHAGFFEAVEGLEPDDAVQHTDLSFSDDDGASWQHRRLTSQLKRPGVTGIFAAAGQGIQIHTGPFTGRLVQQMVVLCEGVIRCASAFSDDHGESWHLGELVPYADDAAGTGNENKVVCLNDGTLLLHSRATPHRLAAHSYDGGATYSQLQAVTELPDPGDNGSLVRWDGLPNVPAPAIENQSAWLLATHNHHTQLRRNTVLKLSRDNGASWPHSLVLCEGSSAYSTAARLSDGRIGVLYERQGYQEIVFVSVDQADLVNAPPAPAGPEPEFEVVLRSITPGRPTQWRTVGEAVALAPAGSDWDASVWKEVGQGYSEQAPQILSNRESQDLNYGPVIPGFKAGDVLAFSAVEKGRRIDTTRLVSEEDIAAGTVHVTFSGDDTSQWARFALDVESGDIRTGDSRTSGITTQSH